MQTDAIEERVKSYWGRRAHDFAAVRRNELRDAIREDWLTTLLSCLNSTQPLRILDVGTGTGYFAVLLAGQGHHVTGIDLSEAMLAEAVHISEEHGVKPDFLLMDAQKLDFADESFDAVISRNLTWTLPDAESAYQEWYRVLKLGGVLVNFDANYGDNVRHQRQRESYVKPDSPYGHIGMTAELERENAEITLSMAIADCRRPFWDMQILKKCGFSECSCDTEAGKRILKDKDLADAPLFLVLAKK